MNLDELYEELKAAIRYFGVAWDEKELVQVWIEGGRLYISYGDQEISFPIPGSQS